MAHLTRGELVRWRDVGADADRERMVAHLAECDECAAACAELVRTPPLEASDAVFDPEAFVATGYRARARQRRGWRALNWRPIALAASVALVVVAVVGPLWRTGERGKRAVLRGVDDTLTLVRPVGDISGADGLVFEWTSTSAGRYRLTVSDLANLDAPLIARDVTEPRYAPTSTERERLAKGHEYHWFVEYRDTGGRTVSSPAARFQVR